MSIGSSGPRTGKYFPMSAFEARVAEDPEILGAFYSGSQGRGTMDVYSDLDLMVWVTDAAHAEGGRKVAELLATLGEVQYCYPLQPKDGTTALVGPDWQRVDLELHTESTLTPWPAFYGSRILKDTGGVLERLLAQAPEKPDLPTPEEAAEFFAERIDSQIFLALHNARGAVWSAMGEVTSQSIELYTFLARLRGVNSYGPRYVEQLLSPDERSMLEATVAARPERDEVRRAARAFWKWLRYVWREAEIVLGEEFPIRIDEPGLLDAVDRIYEWE